MAELIIDDAAVRTLMLIGQKKRDSGDKLAAYTWDEFHGQANLKRTLGMFIESARKRGERLDHMLLAAPPGFGKTTLAQIIASQMGTLMVNCALPVEATALVNLIKRMGPRDILFLDEVHLITQKRGALEALLPILMTGKTLAGVKVPDVTVVAATTDKDKLPPAFLDRFPLKPYFDPYTVAQMRDIIKGMAKKYGVTLEPDVVHSLARASNGVPRLAGNLVRHARVLRDNKEEVTADKVLRFAGLTEDGLCREQLEYVKTLYRNPKYVAGETVYRMGFTTLVGNMREPKETVYRLEGLLVDLGYVQHESSGRRLTDKGISLARRYA